MKTRRLIFVLVVIVLGAPLLLLLKPVPPTPPITSGFLGFTNHPTIGQAAVFAVTNYPEGAIFPVVFDVAMREGGEWKSMLNQLNMSPPWELSVGGRPEVVYTLSVPATNVPVRVVMEIRTEPTGWRALAQRALVKMGRSENQWHVRLPAQYFTNETVCPAPSP